MLKAKLVIWDLDDTLWSGTLAEGDQLEPFENRVRFIKDLNERGVVNSICSKNDFDLARSALEGFGLWDEFVFAEIQMEAKGQIVKQIIEDMQLRAPDVIFIDDNVSNLNEVKFFNEGIQVLDANDPSVDAQLEEWVASLKPGKSRVGEYRQLEAKRAAKTASGLDNRQFLETCNIRVALVRRSDNLPYAGRIEELINRTNQMNFTKSRVPEGSMPEFLINPRNDSFAVFVWDDFGFYGLVGFACVSWKKLVHLTYSCRIMNMGVEQAVGRILQEAFPELELPHEMFDASWVRFVDPSDPSFTEKLAQESAPVEPVPLRIMANCQSGALAHYLGVQGISWDNWPRIFKLDEMLTKPDELARMSTYVYGVFNDYDDRFWSEPPTTETYEKAIDALIKKVVEYDAEIIAVLPSQNFDAELPYGVTPERFVAFNDAWRLRATQTPDVVKVVEVDPFLTEKTHDPRHFTPDVLREVSLAARPMISKIPL